MTALIAMVFADEAAAAGAADEIHGPAGEPLVDPEAVATLVRARDGSYRVVTRHHPVAAGPSWGLLWAPLFGLLFFVPVLGDTVGEGLAGLLAAIEAAGVDGGFQDEVREMVTPGTSALFTVIDPPLEPAVDALSELGGSIVVARLSTSGERRMRRALHGGGS